MVRFLRASSQFSALFLSPDVTEDTNYPNFKSRCLVHRGKKFPFVAFCVTIQKKNSVSHDQLLFAVHMNEY